jgi:site-specific recombinase XerC
MPLLECGRGTLGQFAETLWRTYAIPNLAPKTRRIYAELWDRHVLPRIGGMTLRKLSPEVVASFRADLTAAGVGDATVRKTLAFVQGMLQRAVEWRRIDSNPVRAVRKPPQRRARVVEPPPAAAVEQIRAELRSRKHLRDVKTWAMLVASVSRSREL